MRSRETVNSGEVPSPRDSVAFDVQLLGRMPHHWGRAFDRCKLETTDTYSELSAGLEGIMCWEFMAANITAQDQGYIPGVHRIYIDKLLARPLRRDEVDWMLRLTHGQQRSRHAQRVGQKSAQADSIIPIDSLRTST